MSVPGAGEKMGMILQRTTVEGLFACVQMSTWDTIRDSSLHSE